jgi:hypothetical protein
VADRDYDPERISREGTVLGADVQTKQKASRHFSPFFLCGARRVIYIQLTSISVEPLI